MATFVQQLYTNCLAEATYYLENNGEAAIIDPLRDPQPYLDLAASRGARIRYVFETHFHADFVSGHRDLAAATGAPIIYGPGAKAEYDIVAAADGQRFPLGDAQLEILHTPGHTLESICLLLHDDGKPVSVFTGDTLFVGDVGRPDLAVKSDLSREDLARHMYRSITTKILPLADDIVVYPGHGAGSACGKNIGKETVTTIGEQRARNYALQPMSEAQFVAALTDGLTTPPQYFFFDAGINKRGPAPIAEVMQRNLKLQTAEAFQAAITEHPDAVILDTRTPAEFAKGFIPNSLNVGLNGQYAIWVGTLLHIETPLLLVTDPGKEEESVARLARVGYETVAGVLSGGIPAWQAAGLPVATIADIAPADFVQQYQTGVANILDVRNPGELSNLGMLAGAVNIPLGDLEHRISELDPAQTWNIHCAGGYRSMIAASILRKHGFPQVVNIQGGFGAIVNAGAPVVQLATA